MTGERQPATDLPAWLREVMELVERRFDEPGEVATAVSPPLPAAAAAQGRLRRFWSRIHRAWESISWDAWEVHG